MNENHADTGNNGEPIFTWSNGEESGPYSLPELRRGIESGEVSRSCYARRASESDWRPLGEFIDSPGPVGQQSISPERPDSRIGGAKQLTEEQNTVYERYRDDLAHSLTVNSYALISIALGVFGLAVGVVGFGIEGDYQIVATASAIGGVQMVFVGAIIGAFARLLRVSTETAIYASPFLDDQMRARLIAPNSKNSFKYEIIGAPKEP
jgi:hypothetical protein